MEAQKNDFKDLNSGIYVTFYIEQESWRDFDPGEAMIAVIANHIFPKSEKSGHAGRKHEHVLCFVYDFPSSQEGFCGSKTP